MPVFAILLPLIAQLGPTVGPGPGPVRQETPLEIPRNMGRPAAATDTRLADCLTLARSAPLDALDLTEAWQEQAKGGAERAGAEHCAGLANATLGRWEPARDAFLAARDDTPANELAPRAKLGAMAGNAALAGNAAERALELLDLAHGDALGAGNPALAGEISIDRARALVVLERINEAAAAMAEARERTPQNPQVWLLSATLSRRQGSLAEAQSQIERAAELIPVDPEIGLEAGVIAVLSGRDEAARKSWESVIAAAPDSEIARTAGSYLAQLPPKP